MHALWYLVPLAVLWRKRASVGHFNIQLPASQLPPLKIEIGSNSLQTAREHLRVYYGDFLCATPAKVLKKRSNINSNNSYYKAWPMKWSNNRDSVMNSVCEILDQGGHGELTNR